MNQLSEQQAKIEEAMSQPDVATDIAKLSDLQKELDAVSTQLDQVETDWTMAAEELEQFDAEQS